LDVQRGGIIVEGLPVRTSVLGKIGIVAALVFLTPFLAGPIIGFTVSLFSVAVTLILTVLGLALTGLLMLLPFVLIGWLVQLSWRAVQGGGPPGREAGSNPVKTLIGTMASLVRRAFLLVGGLTRWTRTRLAALAQFLWENVLGKARFVAGILFEMGCGLILGVMLGVFACLHVPHLPHQEEIVFLGGALGAFLGVLVGIARSGPAEEPALDQSPNRL
jgi:hypothetical protein